jgi:hypothetical protein
MTTLEFGQQYFFLVAFLFAVCCPIIVGILVTILDPHRKRQI